MGNALLTQPSSISLMSPSVRRTINIQVPIYAIQNGSGVNMYSLNFNPSQASPTLNLDLINLIISTNEYIDLVKDFGFIKLDSIGLKMAPTVATSQFLDVLTPVFACITAGGLTTYTADSAAASDASLELLLNSTNNRGIVKQYRLPGVCIGSSGYAFGGSQAWIAVTSYSSSANLKLLIGYKNAPTFNTSTKTLMVATIDVAFNMQFGCSTFAN
jgi:hypothetical protein